MLGEEDDADPEVADASMLPSCLGGLGLQCGPRTAPAACWAAWADALPILRGPDAAPRPAELTPALAVACLR